MTAGEIMGLVLLPPHPRNEVGVRGLTASPFYSCNSANGTLTALTLRTTHRQEGLPQTQDRPRNTGLCPFPCGQHWLTRGCHGMSLLPPPWPLGFKHPRPKTPILLISTIRNLGLGHIHPSWAIRDCSSWSIL